MSIVLDNLAKKGLIQTPAQMAVQPPSGGSSSGGSIVQRNLQAKGLLGNVSQAAPEEPRKSGLEKFANTISAPFKAINKALGVDALVGTLAKPVGEVVAGVNELQGKQAPSWTNDSRLQSPEMLALGQTGGRITPETSVIDQELKDQGYQGANFTDVLNVGSLIPGQGLAARGVGTVAAGGKVVGSATKFLPGLARAAKEAAPAALGWGAAYGAADGVDQRKSVGDVIKSTAVGAGVGLLAGAGLATGGSLAGQAIKTGSRLLDKNVRTQNYVSRNRATLDGLNKNNKTLQKISEANKAQGIDVLDEIANSDFLLNSVDEDGSISTTHKGGGLSQINDFLKNGNGEGSPESVIRNILNKEGLTVRLVDVENALIRAIKESGLEGSALETAYNNVVMEMKGLERRSQGNGIISLATIQDAKISKTNTVNHLDPGSKIADKKIARAYKKMIESNTKSTRVKELNAELATYYAMRRYLKALHGTKVKGGRLGKYFARTLGSIAGGHFGPLGSIAGGEIAGSLQGKMLASNFGKATGKSPEASQLMKEAVEYASKPNEKPKQYLERLALPAPATVLPMADKTHLMSQDEARAYLGSLGALDSGKPIPTIGSLQSEITSQVEKFRREAGLMADKDGAGTTHRLVTDANGNDGWLAKGFSLNKAKASMHNQAASAKKYAHTMLYENDVEFRKLVDSHDELLEANTVTVTAKDDIDALFATLDKEIKTIETEKTLYEKTDVNRSQTKTTQDVANIASAKANGKKLIEPDKATEGTGSAKEAIAKGMTEEQYVKGLTLKVTKSEPSSGTKYYDLTISGKKVGEIETLKDYFGKGDVHIQFVGVDESSRGKGLASEALRKIIKENPNAVSFSAEPTNKAAFDMNIKVLGKPSEISNDIRDLTLKEARESLPNTAKYLADGELDSSSRVFVRFNQAAKKANK